MMRYLIVEDGEVFQKFEVDKSHLAKVKSRHFDMIIDTEENKVFRRESKFMAEDEYNWFEIKAYDKRYEDE